MDVLMFFISMLFGYVSYRPDFLFNKQGLVGIQPTQRVMKPRSLFSVLLQAANGIAFTSMIFWGFINIKWWLVLLFIAGVSIVGDMIVNLRTAAFFWAIRNITAVISVCLTIFLWIN